MFLVLESSPALPQTVDSSATASSRTMKSNFLRNGAREHDHVELAFHVLPLQPFLESFWPSPPRSPLESFH